MMTNSRKSAVMYVTILLLLAAAVAIGGLCVPTAAQAETGDIYTQDFTSATAVNADFAAYYQLKMGAGSSRTVVGDSAHSDTNYYVSGGELIRHPLDDDIFTSETHTTDSFAILTLTKRQYVNFDLSVEYKMGAGTDFWPVVAFRQQEEGKYFLETGAGVFVQKEGAVTLWGSDVDGIGGPYEKSVQNYSRDSWHTLRIRLDGIDLSVWLDNGASPAFTRKLPLSAFKRGYISLISVNNESRFRNLTVTELAVQAVSGNTPQAPVQSADTEDSLDNMAQAVDRIEELAGHTAQSQPAKKKGCGSAAAATAFPLATIVLVGTIVFVGIRKKAQSSEK